MNISNGQKKRSYKGLISISENAWAPCKRVFNGFSKKRGHPVIPEILTRVKVVFLSSSTGYSDFAYFTRTVRHLKGTKRQHSGQMSQNIQN